MKDVQNSNEYEPTIKDVMASIQDLTEAVQTGFERVEKGHDRHEGILTTLVEGQQNLRELLNERTSAINTRLDKTQSRVEDIVDVLEKAPKKTSGINVSPLLYADK